jgi:hypothetical protein
MPADLFADRRRHHPFRALTEKDFSLETPAHRLDIGWPVADGMPVGQSILAPNRIQLATGSIYDWL